jgi:hypothetical protein
MHVLEKDWRYLAHHNGVYRFDPVAKRTRLQVAKLKENIHLMKTVPRLREMQEEDRANQALRAMDFAAMRPLSFMTADDRKKLARAKRERRSWQLWDLDCRRKKNPLAKRRRLDLGSSTHSEGGY